MENRADIPFDELLAALRDEAQPVPAKYLYRLTDLAGEELASVAELWPHASLARRRSLVEDLETLEETYTLASFIEIYKLAIADEDPQVRITGLRAIWDYEDLDLIPAVLHCFENDPEAAVRAGAAAALGRYVYLSEVDKLPEKTAASIIDALLAVLDSDSDETIRRRALESLGYCGRESISDHIREAHQYGDDEWVATALTAMGRSLDEDWSASVLDKFESDNPAVLLEAARAAGLLNIDEAVPALINLLEHEDEDLRYAAVWSLSEIGGEEARDALDDLLALVDDEEEVEFLDSAMENLFLIDEIKELSMMDFSEEDLEDLNEIPDNRQGD
ncbi:MAG: HEAT repeat domain-containing protein [Anaerolineae bacterium]|nr:HEAT repeat domain-containing protein [Anaerolineae bacterium]